MNIAFLVEGTTELQLYPRWIQHLANSSLSKCTTGYQDVVANQFTIFNVPARTQFGSLSALHCHVLFCSTPSSLGK
jgi:hypothetical protein